MTSELQILLRNTRLLYQGEIWISPGWRVPAVCAGQELASLLHDLSFLGCKWGKRKLEINQIIANDRNVRNVLTSKWRMLPFLCTFSL